METERIHHLTEQANLVQRACFMHNDKSFSKGSFFDSEPENLFDSFSTSKAVKMEVQEYLKRSLVIDGDSVTPFKKRKQLHEETDCCDVSFDQIMQKSEKDEGINENLKKENYDESKSNASQKSPKESQIKFNLQSSVFVKVDDSMEWTRLKCFESIAIKESKCSTFFAGGPIQSSAFFVSPNHMEVNQYIAVSVSNVIPNKHSYNDAYIGSGLIQFWNLGSLNAKKPSNHLPTMELAFCHNIGIISELKWCPADYYDKYPSVGHLPRMGLLAASSLDSCIYIYNVPQPDFMPKVKPTFPIYFTQPSWKLTPLFGRPSNVTRKAVATCIDWEQNGKRIVAGYGNGAVCVWLIKVPSFTSYIGVKKTDQSYIIQPYLFFQSSGAPIKSLSFAPFNNHRWLVVLSLDGFIRLFDLIDTSVPFKIIKQKTENTCIWAEVFCGVYSSPLINHLDLITLSATDCGFESTREQQRSSRRRNRKKEKERQFATTALKAGGFDFSTHVAASRNGTIHAIANMAGAVTVNFLTNLKEPLEPEYATYSFLDTEVIALYDENYMMMDLERKDLQNTINISGNVLSIELCWVNDTKGPLQSEIKQVSSASSSSSGFCSPKHDKTIIIETNQCFASDAVHLLKNPPKSSPANDFKDDNNNRVKASPNKLLKCEDRNDEMIKCSDFSEDLMHDLLMLKVSRQLKSSSHIFPIKTSNNSAICHSNDTKQVSNEDFVTSASSDYSGDTIVYPIEDYYWDTSHSIALKSVKSNELSETFDLKEKQNTTLKNTEHKLNGKSILEHQFLPKNSLNCSCSEIKSEISSEKLPSNNKSELNAENCQSDSKNMNLKKSANKSSAHFSSPIFNNLKGKKHNSKNSFEEIMKNEKKFLQNLDAKSNLISKKDIKNLSLHENVDASLCDVIKPNNSNHFTPLSNLYSYSPNNNFIICDTKDKKLSIQALNQSSAASDYSGDTIIYSLEGCGYNDVKYLNSEKPGAISQSLCKKEQKNAFHDISLHKMEEEAALHESETKLLSDNGCSSTTVKCENFLSEKLLKCHSAYETETDSATECCNLTDKDENFDDKDFLISNFHLLHSEFSYVKSEEKLTVLNEQLQSGKDPQKLSYENLISRFGVIFKNNIDESAKPLLRQKHDFCVGYNPLSKINTISWNPNNGCQSWLFVGGNSGIGQLVFVPNLYDDEESTPETGNDLS